MDTSNFSAIGTGQNLAEAQFMIAGFEKRWPLPEALALTFAAKIRAETSAGVGHRTDIAIIRPGGIIQTSEEHIGNLRGIYERWADRTREVSETANSEVRKYLSDVEKGVPQEEEETLFLDQGKGGVQDQIRKEPTSSDEQKTEATSP